MGVTVSWHLNKAQESFFLEVQFVSELRTDGHTLLWRMKITSKHWHQRNSSTSDVKTRKHDGNKWLHFARCAAAPDRNLKHAWQDPDWVKNFLVWRNVFFFTFYLLYTFSAFICVYPSTRRSVRPFTLKEISKISMKIHDRHHSKLVCGSNLGCGCDLSFLG